MDNFESSSIENIERFGRNITLEVDIIRHPEKDSSGNLTPQGLDELRDKLSGEVKVQQFDTIKFYVSPHKRGIQTSDAIKNFLENNRVNSTIRVKKSLLDKDLMSKIGENMVSEVVSLIKQEHGEQGEQALGEDYDRTFNEYMVDNFFDNKFPDSEVSGKDIAESINSLMEHIKSVGKRLYSGSKVKIVMIGHSGVVEHYIKLIYCRAHPEIDPKNVTTKMLGGLMNYIEGPRITINIDSNGKTVCTISYKDIRLDLEEEL